MMVLSSPIRRPTLIGVSFDCSRSAAPAAHLAIATGT